MPLLLAGQDALLKDFYGDAVREQLNQEIPTFKLFTESEKQFSGRRLVFPVHTGRNVGVGSRNEGGTLPTGGAQAHNLTVITATYFYARGRISGQTKAAGKHAFAEALATEMEGLVKDAKVDLSRQSWGTGDGRLAQVGSSATTGASGTNSGTSIQLFNRFFEPGQPGARYLNTSQAIEGGTVAAPSGLASNVIVKSISISSNPAVTNDTIQVSGTYGGLSTCESFIFNNSAGGTGIEALGLLAIVDEYTRSNMWGSNAFYGSGLLGINRDPGGAGVAAWNAIVLDNSGVNRVVDGNLVQTAFDEVNVQSGEEPDLILAHHSVVRAFLDSVSADRRYVTGGTPSYDAGYEKLSYNGVELVKDRFAPYNSMLICKKSSLRRAVLKPIGFADDDGAILSRVADQDNWDFWLSYYWNMFVDGNMKSLCMIRDIRTDL